MRVIRIFLLSLFLYTGLSAQERPNILWLVTEDMSPYLSCYGNKMIKTPNLDNLAADGIRYTQAHSNSVQCSPSRSTLISGIYGVSLGTDNHRSSMPVLDSFYFPIYLRDAGYYCINVAKQDYNNQKTPQNVWDVSKGNADYNTRPDKKKPFFAVYNQGITHMTRVVSPISERKGKRTVALKDVIVPNYVPDLPEVRDDISWNMDAVLLMDKWVGDKIEELKKNGEYDNTIIFFYSDHGGTVPRGKGHIYETGTLIPLIISFPEKWKHLAKTGIPSVSNRLVSFIDFAPTVLSLAGVDIPSFMQGKPFFTDAGAKQESNNKYIFTFRANQGPSFTPSRAITDGRYKLIWNFQSAYPNGTRQDYQWQMPAQQAWDIANMKGTLTSPVYKAFWKPVDDFELYDLEQDSTEINNLTNNPKYAAQLAQLKLILKDQLYQVKDAGLLPPGYRNSIKKSGDLYSQIRDGKININEVIDAASIASHRKKTNVSMLTAYLKSKNPAVQYWGASGLCGLAKVGLINSLTTEALTAFNNENNIEEVRCMLAEAMVYTGQSGAALQYLAKQAGKNSAVAMACLQNVGSKAKPVTAEIKQLVDNSKIKNKFYLRSVLINCNALPYADLYKTQPGEKSSE